MEHVAVNSSQIASIAFDSGTMQVLFRRGGLYEYSDVSTEEYLSVLRPGAQHGGSVGTAFGALIKGRKTFRKLEGTPWPSGNGTAAQQSHEDGTASPSSVPEPPVPAEVQIVSRKSTELTEQAQLIEVVDQKTQEMASEVLLAIAGMRKEIADTFKPMKDAAYKAHKTICDQERALDNPLLDAERTLKNRIGGFVQEQQRLARAAEEEQRRAERERAEEEARRVAEEQALDQAIDLEARGNTEAAEAVLQNPAPVAPRYVAPAPIAPAVAQVKGVTTRMEWDFKIVDIAKIPREYLMVNEIAIRNLGKNTKGRINIPGVEFFEKPVVAASRRG